MRRLGHHRVTVLLSMLSVFLGAALLLVGPAAFAAGHARVSVTGAPVEDCLPQYIIPSPNPDPFHDNLRAVASISPNDAWAVGYYPFSGSTKGLIEHWNGTSWQIVTSPGSNVILFGVAALSSSNVWAVGYALDSVTGLQETLVEHWNGSSWSIIASPNPGVRSYFYGVAAVSANDIWAVGYSFSSPPNFQTLIEHWDGVSWSVIPSANVASTDNYLNGVAAVSASDIWAVGYFSGSVFQTLVEHWDGMSWSIIPSPNEGSPSTSSNTLQGVTALSASDVWAVGAVNGGPSYQTLAEHWNGLNWSIVSRPNTEPGFSILRAVAAISSTDVWAVGDTFTGGYHTVIEHWNGSHWSFKPGANASRYDNMLFGVAAFSPRGIWAVGSYSPEPSNETSQTLIERYVSNVPPGCRLRLAVTH